MKTQAKVGGQVGKNGYFYKGGQFLPSTELPPGTWKIGKKFVKTGKEQIEPYVYEVQPTPFSRSIFSMIVGWCTISDKKLELRTGICSHNGEPITLETEIRPGVKGVLGKDEVPLGEFISAYNNGQRWFDVQPNVDAEYIIKN
jgi:hypothetical protein